MPSRRQRRSPVTARASHPWDVSTAEARAIQERLREAVVREDQLEPPRYVAGTDVAFPERGVSLGAVAVLSFPALELVEHVTLRRPTRFPYVPGLLSFREIPVLLAALARLRTTPDLLLCDGQGLAHPRRFGLASHLGVVTGLPAIGVAKSRLVGAHDEPGWERGCRTPLVHDGEIIGTVLRTRTGVRPVYVSIGHRVSLETAARYALACCTRYRLPETTRWADRLAAGGPVDHRFGGVAPPAGCARP